MMFIAVDKTFVGAMNEHWYKLLLMIFHMKMSFIQKYIPTVYTYNIFLFILYFRIEFH